MAAIKDHKIITSPGSRVYLEEFNEKTIPQRLHDYHLIWTDPPTVAWIGQLVTTIEDSQERITRFSKLTNPDILNYGIMLPSSPLPEHGVLVMGSPQARMIGLIGVIRLDPNELGYMLHSDFLGKGYASEAMRLFLPVYWKTRPDAEVLEAHIDTDNLPSIALSKKFGFVQHRIEHETHEIQGKGKRDSVIYRLERPQ